MAKGIYVGGPKPKWTMVWITPTNINQYFTVSNSTAYTFVGSGGSTYTANNLGVNSSTATMKLTLKQDVGGLQCAYMYTTESNYDKFYIYKNGTAIVNGVSGSISTPGMFNSDGAMKAGDYIEFQYVKDGSQHAANETCYFQALAITVRGEDDTTNGVARKVKETYVGVEGVARKVINGYVGVDGVARSVCGSNYIYWEKYQCQRSEIRNYSRLSYAEETIPFGWNMAYDTDYSSHWVSYGFDFDANEGYYQTMGSSKKIYTTSTLAEIQNIYEGSYTSPPDASLTFDTDPCQVVSITSISHGSNYIAITGTMKRVGKATYTVTGYEYNKRGNVVNYIPAIEGELPEQGNLVEGSATGEYCVLSGISGSSYGYFYYAKIDASQIPIVTWNKYECTATGYFTEGAPYTANQTHSFVVGTLNLDGGFGFSSSSGYYGTNHTVRTVSEPTVQALNSSHVGYHSVYTTIYNRSSVYSFKKAIRVDSYDPASNHGYATFNVENRDAVFHPQTFTQGSTIIDTINCLEGSLPENHTLVEGSASGSYCILRKPSNGQYFYYVKL